MGRTMVSAEAPWRGLTDVECLSKRINRFGVVHAWSDLACQVKVHSLTW